MVYLEMDKINIYVPTKAKKKKKLYNDESY